ncbi:MAG: ABC transporter substrate-binding protein [Leptolyngbya sp. BL-A-14]
MARGRWQPYRALLVLAIVTTIALTACSTANFKASANRVTQLVATTASDPKTFNYALIQEYPNVAGFIYEGLIFEDGKGNIQPALAEAWTFAPDKRSVVFTLREGLKWSDGHPLTAEDVIFSYRDLYLNPKLPTSTQDVFKIGTNGALPTIRKLDDRRVEFTLPEPFAPFLRNTGAAIMPAHVLQKTIAAKDAKGQSQFFSTWGTDVDPKTLVVAGPYQIASYTPSQRLVFERNPYYWRKDAQGNQQPYIQRIIWQIVPSGDTALVQFRSGGLDMVGIGPGSFSLLKRSEKRGNFTIYNGGPDSGTTFLTFNLNKGKRNGKPLVNPIKSRWFNTKEFRQAVAYAIDRQTMINNILRGLGATQNSPISVQSPYYLSPQAGLKVYDYNPAKAKALLQSAGFKYNSRQQLVDSDNHPVRFTLLSNTGGRTTEAIGAQIKRNLGEIGIQVDFSLIDFGTLVEKVSNTFDWEAQLGGITGGVEPNNGANLWLPDGSFHVFNQKPEGGQAPIEGREVAAWETEIGRLYIAGAREFDETKRKEIYAETQRLSQENLPFIYLVNALNMAAVRNRVKGVAISSLYYESVLWNVFDLKVEDQ